MRFLKIVLIIFSSVIIIGVLYVSWEVFVASSGESVPLLAWIYIGVISILSFVNILYHIKSFRFYRRKEKQHLDRKLAKFLWAGAFCFSTFLLFLFGTAMCQNWRRYWDGSFRWDDILFISLLTIPALIGFLEISLLQKRIKYLKTILETKDEIDTIGDSTL